MSDRELNARPPQSLTDAGDVVVQVTDILRSYLETDSSFTPEMAVERVRTVINSKAGMSAFVQYAIQPDEANAEAVVVSLAEALDDHGPSPEETVLRLVEITESQVAVEVYDHAVRGRDPEATSDHTGN